MTATGSAPAIQAVIFDFFDVIRTDPYKAWLTRHGWAKTGPFLEVSQQQDHGRITVDQFLARLEQLSGEPVTREIMEAGAKVDDQVVAVLAQLHGPYRTALLSNAPSKLIRDLLRDHDLERYFDEIVVSSEVGHIKPGPEIFELALKRLAVPAPAAVFIDDDPRNTAAAERLGLRAIQFTSAAQLHHDLATLGIQVI
jgi:2-haloacid dehalogenase